MLWGSLRTVILVAGHIPCRELRCCTYSVISRGGALWDIRLLSQGGFLAPCTCMVMTWQQQKLPLKRHTPKCALLCFLSYILYPEIDPKCGLSFIFECEYSVEYKKTLLVSTSGIRHYKNHVKARRGREKYPKPLPPFLLPSSLLTLFSHIDWT